MTHYQKSLGVEDGGESVFLRRGEATLLLAESRSDRNDLWDSVHEHGQKLSEHEGRIDRLEDK